MTAVKAPQLSTVPHVKVDLPTSLLTLEQWEELEFPDELRFELVEGRLAPMPSTTRRRMRASLRLAVLLESALPKEWAITQETDAVLWEVLPTVRKPDITVYASTLDEPNRELRLTAAYALLAVEIVSPGSRRLDRLVKRQEYQDAGIAHYWIVDLDAKEPAERFLAYALRDGVYQQLDVLSGDHVRIALPVYGADTTPACSLEFDLADLTAR